MSFRRAALVATLSVVALTAAACGGDDDTAAPEPEVAEAPEFEAGTTMAELAEAGSIRVGTKFDQPGFGLENLEGEVEGFDVEVAKIIAGGLGIAP
jgi:glutamate transport system substrate-binding protein